MDELYKIKSVPVFFFRELRPKFLVVRIRICFFGEAGSLTLVVTLYLVEALLIRGLNCLRVPPRGKQDILKYIALQAEMIFV